MPRMVKCVKLGKELPGIIYKPFQNELGERIYQNVSQDAWRLWIEHSKMLVNEYRLDLTAPQGQKTLLDQAEKFFFGGGGEERPADYVPPPAAAPAPALAQDAAQDPAAKAQTQVPPKDSTKSPEG